MDKDESGRTVILDDLEDEETYKEEEEVERQRFVFDAFPPSNDPSVSTDESEKELAFPALALALGRGGSLKMRYALEEVAVVGAVVAMVARRMDTMLKFMVVVVIRYINEGFC